MTGWRGPSLRKLTVGIVLALGAEMALGQQSSEWPVSFRVQLGATQAAKTPQSGRLLIGVAPAGENPDFTNYRPPCLPILGMDVQDFAADRIVQVDESTSVIFPEFGFGQLPPGEYVVRAILATNRDIDLPDAPGNLRSESVPWSFNPQNKQTVDLVLEHAFVETIPPESATHKYFSLPSKLLTRFHGRPMHYRFAVVLPENFERAADQHYGLLLYIGGFGTRYTDAAGMPPDPRFVQVLVDGAGPFGDPYQVDSANNGPYGEALTTEVIPWIEQRFRCWGRPDARFTTGGSTGGWVSLALQIFYPDYFNGCWSQCPDSVTFERFELVDLYRDSNAFVNPFGVERPSTRTLDGDTISTLRHEVLLERVLGRGGRWTLSGRDWASWNAVYGPRGADGLPVPVWNGETGAIDPTVAEQWKKYDLLRRVVDDWPALGPKLAGGKIHIWMGDSDDYFLNPAVRRFKDAVEALESPRFDGTILIEARRGHESGGWTRAEMLDAMHRRIRQ